MGVVLPAASVSVTTTTPTSPVWPTKELVTVPSALRVSMPVAPDSARIPPMLRLPSVTFAAVESLYSTTRDRAGLVVPVAPSLGSRPVVMKRW